MSARKIERGGVLAIGLMSGTSHDGVSAAIVNIDERKRPPARAISVARQARIALSRIELIGSHGHTFFHRPHIPSVTGVRGPAILGKLTPPPRVS